MRQRGGKHQPSTGGGPFGFLWRKKKKEKKKKKKEDTCLSEKEGGETVPFPGWQIEADPSQPEGSA